MVFNHCKTSEYKHELLHNILLRNSVNCDILKHELIKRQSCHHIETSQLICRASQLTGFYVMATLALNDLKHFFNINSSSYSDVFFQEYSKINIAVKCTSPTKSAGNNPGSPHDSAEYN